MIKHKLIAATLTSAVVGGTITLLPFKEVNIKPQLDKIHEATNTVNEASTVINNLVEQHTSLSNENKTLSNENKNLSSEHDKLQKEINDGVANSNLDYETPPSMASTFGNKLSKKINTTLNSMGSYCESIPDMINEYFNTQFHQQLVNYYKYLYSNGLYYKGDDALSNREFLYDQEVYAEDGFKVARDKFTCHANQCFNYYKSGIAKDPENIKNKTIPVKDQINLNDIKLPTDFKDKNGNTINLQAKLDKCFELYTNYCKTHNLTSKSNLPSLVSSFTYYHYILKAEYSKKYYEYLLKHPEFMPLHYTPGKIKGIISGADNNYRTSCEGFNKQLDSFINKMQKLK